MRRIVLIMMLAALLVLMVAPAASAHVHGLTPLLELSCTGVDNSVTGGNRTNGTPAAAANGGPIAGQIPRDTGNAPFLAGFPIGLGFDAANDNVCP